MFLGLLDPDPDKTVIEARIRIRILISSSKISKKNLDSYCFVTSFLILIYENAVHVPSRSNKQKKPFNKY